MSHSRSYSYYESSRSRSRERRYRRDYREESERYNVRSSISSHAPTDYSAPRYRRSSNQRSSHYHDPPSSSSASSSYAPSGKVVLAVFNLSVYTTEAELYDIFSKFGPLRKTTVVLDAKTGRSRGFGFVYFENGEDAKVAHDQANGIEIGERRIRVDFSATEKPHDPTPGVYYGKVSHPKFVGHPPDHGMSSVPGFHHCRACEVEARDRWERDMRAKDEYYDSFSDEEPIRGRPSAGRRGRRNYYRGGNSIR